MTGHGDVFSGLDSAAAAQWIRALDLRAGAEAQVQLRQLIISIADVSPGCRVLDLGCGTGALLVDLAHAVGPTGRAVGVDPVPAFVDAARKRLAREACNGYAAAHVGDDASLPEGDFDAAVEQSVLIHVSAEHRARHLRNAIASIRRGGRFVAAEQDGDTWTIDHPMRELTRRIVRFNADARYADGWVGRSLGRLLAEAGLGGVRVVPHVHSEATADGYLFGMSRRIADASRAAHVLTADEHDSWMTALENWATRGAFFSSITYFVAMGVTR
jgi:ubiquinone/menaquinone biosynthesis C-methylase UbiE